MGTAERHERFRQKIGRAILLGMGSVVAGGTVGSAAIQPTVTSVGALAIIVLIRAWREWPQMSDLS